MHRSVDWVWDDLFIDDGGWFSTVAVHWWVWWCNGLVVLLLKCGCNQWSMADGFEFAFILFFLWLRNLGFFFFSFFVEKSGFGDAFLFIYLFFLWLRSVAIADEVWLIVCNQTQKPNVKKKEKKKKKKKKEPKPRNPVKRNGKKKEKRTNWDEKDEKEGKKKEERTEMRKAKKDKKRKEKKEQMEE